MMVKQKRPARPGFKRLVLLSVLFVLIAYTCGGMLDYQQYLKVSFSKSITNNRTVMAADKVPAIAAQQQSVNLFSNSKAQIDASNLSEGYILIKYTGGKRVPIKVQITKKSGITYTYNLDNTGKAEIYSLTEGDGEYQINVMENISGTKYALAFGQALKLSLRDSLLPFMYPSQYVNYTDAPKTIAQATLLASSAKTDLDKLNAIYKYIIKNFTYDYELAKTVAAGYIPKVDSVFSTKKGICFDYAALTCSMLRSSGIPSKLVIGYAGDAYHAWINVYIETVGWIEQIIYFDGKRFYLMDPTFASSAGSNPDIYKYIGDGNNYRVKYVY